MVSRASSKYKGKISDMRAMQVLDSRGNPTVQVDLRTKAGFLGRAIVPSGASTGIHEALELRDGDQKIYGGKGVLKACANVNDVVKPKILGLLCSQQRRIDKIMIRLDGTPNKSRLGANAVLGVSMAVARAAALSSGVPLFKLLAERKKYRLPFPMMNVINGGMHAGNKLSVQEFHVEPVGAKSFSEALRWGAEVYHELKQVLKEKYGSSAVNVGDEGGYAPPLDLTSQALDAISSAISRAGYGEKEIRLGLDAASSTFFSKGIYTIDGKSLGATELLEYYEELVSRYPILTLEDPFDEDAFSDFSLITSNLGKKIIIIGDDIYATNRERIERGIREKATNAVLIKLNQVGSVSETLDAISASKRAKFEVVVSHRSGETEDTFIAHLATAVESTFIKAGAPARGERTAKYNELLRIEQELGKDAQFSVSFP